MDIEQMTILVNNESKTGDRTGSISINGDSVHDIDLNWLPKYDCDLTGVSTTIHAVQWYGTHGEIELTTNGSNIKIIDLKDFEIALTYYEEKKLEIEQQALQENINSIENEITYDDIIAALMEDNVDVIIDDI